MQRRRCRLSAAIVLTLILGTGIGCAKHLPTDPPRISAATVLILIDSVEAFARTYCGADPATTCQDPASTDVIREIVHDTGSARVILKAAAVGWQAAVRASWAEARPRFESVTDQKVRIAIAAVTAVLDLL